MTDHYDWPASRHRIAGVTVDRVSEGKAYRNYIENSEFETRNVFMRENNQMTRQDLTRKYLIRQDETIQLTRLNEINPITLSIDSTK